MKISRPRVLSAACLNAHGRKGMLFPWVIKSQRKLPVYWGMHLSCASTVLKPDWGMPGACFFGGKGMRPSRYAVVLALRSRIFIEFGQFVM